VERVAKATLATLVAARVLLGAHRRFGPDSRTYALIAVWAPMAWLGTVSHWFAIVLPDGWHRLRPIEADGRAYELLGVRAAKAALRRGPFAAFNPQLHLPTEPTPERLALLDRKMREAEASHALLLVGTAAATVHAHRCGRTTAARWMVLWNLLMNGYPVMLQRYNRALLHQRFGDGDA
jgi:hypothetical protein